MKNFDKYFETRPVSLYTLDGVLFKTFISCIKCANFLGRRHTNLSKALRRKPKIKVMSTVKHRLTKEVFYIKYDEAKEV